MYSALSERQTRFRGRIRSLIDDRLCPRPQEYRVQGLWDLFMPPRSHAADSDVSARDTVRFTARQLSNEQYALCAEEMRRIHWAPEVFDGSAPDTGNMDMLHRYGTEAQKQRRLKPPMDGEIRSAFLMTEAAVTSSSDAENIRAGITRNDNHYIIDGARW